jgi:hypothetical protein
MLTLKVQDETETLIQGIMLDEYKHQPPGHDARDIRFAGAIGDGDWLRRVAMDDFRCNVRQLEFLRQIASQVHPPRRIN